ncbi:MAG TPA: sensor histidine kinase [Chloroflexia bacterium]|nr:sensor histidine kinase [Chloroflexia bacterium]
MGAESIQSGHVEKLRQDVEAAITEAANRLRGIETVAQQQLRNATTERQHLDVFLDDLEYRLHAVNTSGDLRMTSTGPLTEDQISAMHGQQEVLTKRKVELGIVGNELEQLSSRLSWLIHQIEGARQWVLASSDSEGDGSENGSERDGHPNTGDQVMWAQIALGQEAERARLAREIHDGPAQVLANTVLRLQLVEQLIRQNPKEVEPEISRVRAALQESLKDVRRFIFNLRPASLSDAGLIPTLRYYTQDFSEQFGIDLELNLPENLVLSANQELVVFRVIQEALQNVQKHAQANRIEVNVQQRPGGPLVVNITDDGIGFDPKAVRQSRTGSSGLVSMRERAATVGGTLKADSRVGTGTTITLTLPMPKAQ